MQTILSDRVEDGEARTHAMDARGPYVVLYAELGLIRLRPKSTTGQKSAPTQKSTTNQKSTIDLKPRIVVCDTLLLLFGELGAKTWRK